MVNVGKNGLLESKQPKAKYNPKDCSFCILDGTDACSRGAGRAIDDTICDDFLEDMSIAEFAIMELEKVREEIATTANEGLWGEAVFIGMKKAVCIIDKHISELKGEQE